VSEETKQQKQQLPWNGAEWSGGGQWSGGDGTPIMLRFMDQVALPIKGDEARIYPKAQGQKAPRYPELAFPYGKVCAPGTRLRWLADAACDAGGVALVLDPGLVVPALLCLASAVPVMGEHLGTRINRYTCLLAMSGAGKGLSVSRAARVLGLHDGDDYDGDIDISGDVQIVYRLGEKWIPPETKGGKYTKMSGPKRYCGVVLELEHVISKSRGQASAIWSRLQRMYDRDHFEHANAHTGRTTKMDCRFSMLCCLPVGEGEIDETEFTKAFGQDMGRGMLDRFDFGFSERIIDSALAERWEPPSHSTTIDCGDDMAVERHETPRDRLTPMLVRGWEDGVEERYLGWPGPAVQPGISIALPGQDKMFARAKFLFKKTVVLIAALEGHSKVGHADFNAADAYIRWQLAVRKVFERSHAEDDDKQAKFAERVVKQARRWDSDLAKKGKPLGSRVIKTKWFAAHNKLYLKASPVGLERTLRELAFQGLLALGTTVNSRGDEVPDANFFSVKHSRADCWCGESHPATEEREPEGEREPGPSPEPGGGQEQ